MKASSELFTELAFLVGLGFVSNIITAKSTGNRVTNIIVPIFNEQGVVIGTVQTRQQTASSHEVAEASDKLAENAQELQNLVAMFKL
ncbi:MAG: PDC sensor domain-containing protein [Lachnospiraceae bacterium]|nr:PDC sensor domain-containing protein [Lachnospiraceae bacterium]